MKIYRSHAFRIAASLALIWIGAVLRLDADPPAEVIPLPEHPRPDFERAEWLNLNGTWSFRFDKDDAGLKEKWFEGAPAAFPEKITVPFSWGSKLSGLPNGADIGWYARTVRAPEKWNGKRVFLVIGAADWRTRAWLDGQPIGEFQGGYTPFEFELTPKLVAGKDHTLVLRIDDTPHPFKLEGKQGYGPARGIWQTAYLEARPTDYLWYIHFTPDVDAGKVKIHAALPDDSPGGVEMSVEFKTGGVSPIKMTFPRGIGHAEVSVEIPKARLWSPEDPFLYEVEAVLSAGEGPPDRVRTYFGMRKIGVEKLPGAGYPYIALNGKPFYLQMTLDQSYHPEGFYTFPSDEFMREEILRSRRIGLNAIRVHVKLEVPRKLYWADRLGLLVMEDVPNSWGQPDTDMRAEVRPTIIGMIRRDYNHPAIFSWVLFNETWGLKTKDQGYLPETRDWVRSMHRLAKQLDPSRLVEDNSPCNLDHVETDINSWHTYLPGYAWREHLDQVTRDTSPGSKWNYIGGLSQGDAPLLNSECGNVWGYEGSTGDVDWSWDYHIMMNEFRRHPKVCGWLYTEHHDVINEWNGYYRFDRSPKQLGLASLLPGMTIRDFHAPFYIATGTDLCADARPGETVTVPLWASFLAAAAPAKDLAVRWSLTGWDGLGRREWWGGGRVAVEFEPWMSKELKPLEVKMPEARALAVLGLQLEDPSGVVLHRNFSTFLVGGLAPRDETVERPGDARKERVIRIAPASFAKAEWSQGQWNVLDGLKVNGAGSGFFEYRLPWPEGLDPAQVESASFRAELGAKQLFTKDREHAPKVEGDFMRGKGTLDPSTNPNSYPMTDTVKFPSAVRIRFAGTALGMHDLEDDPADHRGVLSWHSQKRDRKLREAGSYGYLVADAIPPEALRAAAAAKEIVLRLEVDPALPGGLAIYGERFGRYPLDPTLVFTLR
jgi:glycosyl hydrolase family 2